MEEIKYPDITVKIAGKRSISMEDIIFSENNFMTHIVANRATSLRPQSLDYGRKMRIVVNVVNLKTRDSSLPLTRVTI
jgi:hypothetical protein